MKTPSNQYTATITVFQSFILIAGIVLLLSCRKTAQEDNYDETFPTYYEAYQTRYLTPYVRMFTQGGEVRNNAVIDNYLSRWQLYPGFVYSESVPAYHFDFGVYMYSQDSIRFEWSGSPWYPQTWTGGYLQSTARERRIIFRNKYTYNAPPDPNFLKIISKNRFPYEVFSLSPPRYEYVPAFTAYRTESTLEIPVIAYDIGPMPVPYRALGPFDENCYKALVPGDTLLIQECVLVLKKR
jgi:hypothetical protein